MPDDCPHDDRIELFDTRLREVERAVVEIATTMRLMRLLVTLTAAGLGIDVVGVV